MVIYGNLKTCGKCRQLHKILETKEMKFDFIENEEEIMKVAKEYGAMGIPFAIQDGKILKTNELMKFGMNLK